MAIVITEILGTDSISGSRFTINANFNSLKAEIESIESVFGLSLTAGNIDVSSASGGTIKGKIGAFNTLQLPATGTSTITLTGATGAITASTLTLSTSLTVPTLNISLSGTLLNQGSSQFNGTVTLNSLVTFNNGIAWNKVNVGAVTSHTVLNDDRTILFDASVSPAILTLVADASLVDGHIVTLISIGTGVCALDTTLILGFGTGSIYFSADAYKSAITLQYSLADAKWFIVNSSNMTIS